MDLISDYSPLPENQQSSQVRQQKNHLINPLGVTSFQAIKIKRLLSGRLNTTNLTFMDSLQNPQNELQELDKQKEPQQTANSKKKVNIENYLNFSLITKSNLPEYQILINFNINVKRLAMTFESKILKNYRLIKIESRNLVRFMAKYFISYNGKLKQGSFFVNPITSQISFFIHNHSTLDSISSLLRNPQKFLSFVMFYIDQITIKWNECLDSILYMINKKSFQEINPTKKFKYVKMKLNRLSQFVIHSHLDASFFIQNKGIPRFKKMDDEQRKHKFFQLKNQYSNMQKKSKVMQPIQPIIKKFIGQKKMIDATFKFPAWQMPQIKELCQNLACHQYGGKFSVYSQIQIISVDHEVCIFQSGFSKIYRIDAQFKRQQDHNITKAILIKKKTQDKRYKNQVSVLKLLQKQKCLFFPRYYFCQQQEHKQSIFIEFIPESSLDRYLMTKSMFIGNQTKLFFLFQVIIALRFLRDNSIVHIDLKPENVLIKIVGDARQNVHYLIKLIDFGQSYSQKIDILSYNSGRGFTIPYAPPQLLSKGKRFDEKTDVYSFGVIMYKIMFNHFPTQIMKLTKLEFIQEQYLKFYSLPYQKLQNYGTVDFMSILFYLCLKCLQPNPNDRPTLDWLSIILKDLILTYDELTK